MILVKICGITNLEDALAAVEFGADALGFNFYTKSPRYVDPETAAEILKEVPPSIWRVGVFVNEDEKIVRQLSRELELDYLQFHGEETPSYCDQFATPYWKAFPLQDEGSLELMQTYHCEYYLVDTFSAQVYGGSGITGNWDLAQLAKKVGKIFLAGGLTPENIEMAIQVVRPEGVDVATGVEKAPGKKDHIRLEEFITKAKGRL
jgi:phosphoribosylanthranilate isomerase